MSLIKFNLGNSTQVVDLNNINSKSYIDKVKLFNSLDELLLNVNKYKYQNSNEIVKYIKSTRSPEQLNRFKITLLALMNFFQKTYVRKTFKVKLNKIPQHIQDKLNWKSINIISKINNFPHLIGISGLRNSSGEVISRFQPREFLDGVLYQWVLLNSHEEYALDCEKLEVLPWMHQTLSSPTYILSSSAINTSNTKFHADLVFIRRILNSNKYDYHIVGLKNESYDNFTFISQFPITKERHYRIKKMFNLEKAIFDFYKEKKKMPR